MGGVKVLDIKKMILSRLLLSCESWKKTQMQKKYWLISSGSKNVFFRKVNCTRAASFYKTDITQQDFRAMFISASHF